MAKPRKAENHMINGRRILKAGGSNFKLPPMTAVGTENAIRAELCKDVFVSRRRERRRQSFRVKNFVNTVSLPVPTPRGSIRWDNM